MNDETQPAAPPKKRGPGRPPALDPEAIAEAVLGIGFRDLTFGGAAERLGVGQATLYRYAANRDELVRSGLDLAIRRAEWPALEGDWSTLLERWALASWHVWAEHPGAVVEAARGVMPPTGVEITDRVGEALVARGFAPADAVLAVDLVFDLAADNRRGVEALEVALESAPTSARKALEQEWADRHRDGEVARQLRGEMVRAIREEPIEWFRRKLRVVLAGIAHELAPTGRGNQ